MWMVNAFLAWRARRSTRSVTVGGRTRSYYVHVPPGCEPGTPAPVVLALHGATMNGPLMAWFCGLNAKADAAGFLAVYPDGTGSRSEYLWNGGHCCGSAVRDQVDDVAFVAALLDDLAGTHAVDPKRVFATGMSNGAIMAYRLAAELSDRISAIAPVAGSLGVEVSRPVRPVSVLHVHGTRDEYVPFAGGRGPRTIFPADHPSAAESIGAWVTANGCAAEPTVDVLADGRDGLKVTRRTHGGGREGSEVALVVVEGGGHTWPGRKSPAKALGPSTLAVSANDLMWEFFQRHGRA
jgi:polyhydroxybutyrate depolymerase